MEEEILTLQAWESAGFEMLLDTCHHIDAMKLLQVIPDESIGMIHTDPPYEVSIISKMINLQDRGMKTYKETRDATLHDWDDEPIQYGAIARELYRVAKNNTHSYIWCGENQKEAWTTHMRQAGWKYRQYLIWSKPNSTLDPSCGHRYMMQTEIILFFVKGTRKLQGTHSNIFSSEYKTNKYHPCEKPLNIIRTLLQMSSQPGDIILDPYTGSGTTGMAAMQTERRFIGSEREEKYCEIAKKRIKAAKEPAIWWEKNKE